MTTTSRLRLGQLLVDAKMLTQEALDAVLAEQRKDGRRLGVLLVEQGHVSEVQLTQILSHQLSVPWVSLHMIDFSRQLLNLVPRELAEQYCLLPIYVRRVRNHGDTLYIAMDDPSNDEALRACAQYAGLPVRPMIAPPSDIRSAIRAYYGAQSAETEPPPAPAKAPEAQTPRAKATLVSEGAGDAEPAAPPAKAQVHTEAARPAGGATAGAGATANAGATAANAGTTTNAGATAANAGATAASADVKAEPATQRDATPPPPVEVASTPGGRAPSPHTKTLRSPILTEIVEREPALAEEIPPIVRDSRPTPMPASPRASQPAEEDPVIELSAPRPRRATGRSDTPPAAIPSPRGKTPKMMSLTLLDGTTITLPKPRAKGDEAPKEAAGTKEPEAPADPSSILTARDLVGALRAVASGADASTVLGEDVRWESMFAALLSLLLKKQLIADWEFVEELNRLRKR
ncbi:MAG: hypothetical protein R3B70_12455 [Polyangiaceae bacterium]